MVLLILSFIAGVLTVAAPCVLPLLPVIIGGSVLQAAKDKPSHQWIKPLIVAASLAVSVVIFTLAIKSTTVLLGVPQQLWQIVSGGIVLLLGLHFLWPHVWEMFAARVGIANRSNARLGGAYRKQGLGGSVLIGMALGPVFSSCSPTYALIVATILPVSFIEGLVYLIAYALGMSVTLLLIAYAGQAFVARLRWLANPSGWFKRVTGILFIMVGIAVIVGFDKTVQAYVLEQGWYDPISNLEKQLR